MNKPDIRIRWNPSDNDVTLAIALDGKWWGMSGHLAPLVEDDPTSWPTLQPAVTRAQAEQVIADVYNTLQPDMFGDRVDKVQADYVAFIASVMSATGINVEPTNPEDK